MDISAPIIHQQQHQNQRQRRASGSSSSSGNSSSKAREQLASFASGVCARAIEYPFDTIKTKMQAMMKRRTARKIKQQQQQLMTASTSSSAFLDSNKKSLLHLKQFHGTTPLKYSLQQQYLYTFMSTPSASPSTSSKKKLLMNSSSSSSSVASRISMMAMMTCGNTSNSNNLLHPHHFCSSSSSSGATASMIIAKKSPSFKTANRIMKKEGIKGFYRGSSGPMLASAAEMSAAFTGYNRTLECLECVSAPSSSSTTVTSTSSSQRQPPPMTHVLLAGAAAGVATSLVLNPVELIKCRMQTTNRYKDSFDCLRKMHKTSGKNCYKQSIRTLYTGIGATLAREVPGNAAWFGSYEFVLRNVFSRRNQEQSHPWYATPIAGAIAGCFYVTTFYPADTVKTLMQTDRNYSKLSLREGILRVYRQGGIRSLYFGVGISAARAIPSNAVIFSIYEWAGTSST